MTHKLLQILIVEDSSDDTLMLERVFRRAGYELTYERVDSAKAMQAALDSGSWDIILSDYAMPGFGGAAALTMLKESGHDIPFILVSGAIGEETAVEMMKAGAHDYILKDRLHRLIPAVERAIHDAENRRERRRLELEVQHYNRYLEALVAERTNDLEDANSALIHARDEAVKALGVRNQILSNMSHEARTPISVIRASVEALELGIYGEVAKAQQPILENIEQAANRLQVFLNNLIDLASLESETNQVDFQPFSPREIGTSLDKALKSLALARQNELHIEIEPGLPHMITGDRERIWRIVYNLVENAIKFTHKGQITVSFQAVGLDHWSINIVDTGRGIASHNLENVFETYWQEDGSSTREVMTGVGIGLTVVKKYVDLMNGQITIHSQKNRGTHVNVVLPFVLTPNLSE